MNKNIAFFFLAIVLILSACKDRKNRICNYKLSEYYNNCKSEGYHFNDLITFGDPNNKFMISVPYSWDIQENYFDSLYGIVAANNFEAMQNINLLQSISLTGYNSTDSLATYFKSEIKSIINDNKFEIIDLGRMDFKNKDSFWVLFETNEDYGKFINLVLYLKNYKTDEIYLIQTTVYKTKDYKKKICELKFIVNSFEIVEN
ncbi:MAG: hypothetical protein K8R58_10600 [Bacteroidales bacterium]|nr:hypothetical protein [Bacteroidales bacterium]